MELNISCGKRLRELLFLLGRSVEQRERKQLDAVWSGPLPSAKLPTLLMELIGVPGKLKIRLKSDERHN